jgi:glucokinase
MALRSHKPIVGIDLGGTNINVGIVDSSLRVVRGSQVNKKTQAAQGVKVVLDRIAAAVKESLEGAGLASRQVSSIGIAAAGAVDSARGVVLKGGNLGFLDVPLAAELRKRTGVRVLVENDVNAAVYGEWVHPRGAIVGVKDALGVWLGTGIGGGLIFSGKLYRGGFFTAGEIGHTTLIPGAPFGRRSLENNCSRTAIADRLLALMASGHDSVLRGAVEKEKKEMLEKARKEIKDKGKLNWQFESNKILRSRAIAEAYKRNDALTHLVIDEAAEMLGTSIAGAVTLLSLPHVVLGGGLTEALGAPWVRAVRAATRARVFPPELRKVEVVGTHLKDRAGIIGAALLARDAR